MIVNSIAKAWEIVNEIFPTDYAKDESSSSRAGYPVYRSTADGHHYDYICDLGNRLEVNLSDGRTINIVIEEPEKPAVPAEDTAKILYIGLNDKDSKRQEIDTLTAFKLVSRVLCEKCGGATITQTTGIYTHDDGTIVEETSLRAEIFGQPLQPILDACETLKTILNQESIALNEIVSKSRFI